MRLIINILSAVIFILILLSSLKIFETGHYKLFAILITAVIAIALKNNIKSNLTKMIVTAIAGVLVVTFFFLLP